MASAGCFLGMGGEEGQVLGFVLEMPHIKDRLRR